jgi:hypothetical protein
MANYWAKLMDFQKGKMRVRMWVDSKGWLMGRKLDRKLGLLSALMLE